MKNKVAVISATVICAVLFSFVNQKNVPSPQALETLSQLATNKAFRVKAQWANPLSTRSMNSVAASGLLPPGSSPNRIDIVGTTSYLEVRNDSVFGYLPYYGERQFGTVYNSAESGIQFKGIPKTLDIHFNEKKQRYDFSFAVVNKSGEQFDVNGSLFPNEKANFYINSTERLTIGYTGVLEEIGE